LALPTAHDLEWAGPSLVTNVRIIGQLRFEADGGVSGGQPTI